MQFLVMALCVFLPLGLGFELVLQILQLTLQLLLRTLSRLALLSLVLELRLKLPHLLGEVATQLFCLLLLGGQLSLVVGLGSLQIDLGAERKQLSCMYP